MVETTLVGTIVVGANDSGPSRAATDWVIERAQARGLSVQLVHVLDERWLGLGPARDTAVRDHAAAVLDAELERLGADRDGGRDVFVDDGPQDRFGTTIHRAAGAGSTRHGCLGRGERWARGERMWTLALY